MLVNLIIGLGVVMAVIYAVGAVVMKSTSGRASAALTALSYIGLLYLAFTK